MFFPRLTVPAQRRKTVSVFGGLDRRSGGAEGTFAHMENLCGDDWPALTTRPRRGVVTTLAHPNGLIAKDALIWVDGPTLYVNGQATGVALTDGPKQLISMGAWLLIWPDKMYLNTADLTDFGPLERTVTVSGASWMPCRPDGGALSCVSGDSAPEDPAQGTYWLDTGGGAATLRQYADGGWLAVDEACCAIRAAGIGVGFTTGDAVEISGCQAETLDGTFILRAVEDDVIVITALTAAGSQSESLTVSRTVPDMDYVVECGNRLWGCKYGLVDGRTVNEIYASKLGDFKNWHCFAGLSTDSYAASRGSDGVFTGAAAYLGSPLFFKEHCIERVYPSAAGAHQIVTLQCDGVKKGSAASLCVADGTLYYHGVHGFCAFSGSLPVIVSDALGEESFRNAVAGAVNGQYVVSAADSAGRHLLVYDARRRAWHRQDDTEALAFAARDGELYCLASDGRILALHGAAGAPESGPVRFEAVSADLNLRHPHSSYLRRLAVCAALAPGAALTASVSYDGGLTWQAQGTLLGAGTTDRCLLHVRPRRCESLRLKLSGTGSVKVYSLSAVYEKGSDGP